MSLINTIARLSLGFIFMISGVMKGVGYCATAELVAEYAEILGISLSDSISSILAYVLILLELVIGLSFLFRVYWKWTLICTWIILLSFIVINYISLESSMENCGCFGSGIIITPRESIFKNCVLLLMLMILLKYYDFGKSYIKYKNSKFKISLIWAIGFSILAVLNVFPDDNKPYHRGVDVNTYIKNGSIFAIDWAQTSSYSNNISNDRPLMICIVRTFDEIPNEGLDRLCSFLIENGADYRPAVITTSSLSELSEYFSRSFPGISIGAIDPALYSHLFSAPVGFMKINDDIITEKIELSVLSLKLLKYISLRTYESFVMYMRYVFYILTLVLLIYLTSEFLSGALEVIFKRSEAPLETTTE